MKRVPSAPAVTSLPQAPRDEADARTKRYIITISIRIACFILMVAVTPYGWHTWAFAIGAAILPYIAVVFANESMPATTQAAETPVIALDDAAPYVPEPAESQANVITIQEIRRPEPHA